jgi:hypothetical protein
LANRSIRSIASLALVCLTVHCTRSSESAAHAGSNKTGEGDPYGYMLLADFKNEGLLPTDTVEELRPHGVPAAIVQFADSIGRGPPSSERGPFDVRCVRYFQPRARPELYVVEYAVRCPDSTEVIFDNYPAIFIRTDSAGRPHIFDPDLNSRETVPYARTIDGRPIFLR